MNQYILCSKDSPELRFFPHIIETGAIKNTAIRLNVFPCKATQGLRIFYIQEGKFEWSIDHRQFFLYPGDTAIIFPGKDFGNENNVLEIGSFLWIEIECGLTESGQVFKGNWSSLSDSENESISAILRTDHSHVLQKFAEAGAILKSIQSELFDQEIGYMTRVNRFLDEIFIQVARKFTRISNSGRDFPKTFMKLEEELRRNIAHQWTVEEMATLAGMGTTLFNEKVKSYSGFSPLSYLINIRISEAMKLLKKPNISLTDIAFTTGFYSSQHFSTTFRKLTGYAPSQFRKNHL